MCFPISFEKFPNAFDIKADLESLYLFDQKKNPYTYMYMDPVELCFTDKKAFKKVLVFLTVQGNVFKNLHICYFLLLFLRFNHL